MIVSGEDAGGSRKDFMLRILRQCSYRYQRHFFCLLLMDKVTGLQHPRQLSGLQAEASDKGGIGRAELPLVLTTALLRAPELTINLNETFSTPSIGENLSRFEAKTNP